MFSYVNITIVVGNEGCRQDSTRGCPILLMLPDSMAKAKNVLSVVDCKILVCTDKKGKEK